MLDKLAHIERDGENVYIEVVKTNDPREHGKKKSKKRLKTGGS
jgi:hypothetical protein